MKTLFPAALFILSLVLNPLASFSGTSRQKKHDFIPSVHNVIFIVDVSDSMMAGHPKNFDFSRIFIATRAFQMFNKVMPHVSRWQHDLNAALITFGDASMPKLLSALGPWNRSKFDPLLGFLRTEMSGPWRTAGFQEALQLAGQIVAGAAGRTAIVCFTDGGSKGECPQKTVTALKNCHGDRVRVYGVFVGDKEWEWRNIYEVCKLGGGYCRAWEEVRSHKTMKEFAWDITGREIMFPYPEIFFKYKNPDLIPSEALKLESVANFLHAIPQYVLQIDGHTDLMGDTKDNYALGMKRANNVKEALVKIYGIDPRRILVRSWGEELPRYDDRNPEVRQMNRQANLYLMLPLRNFPYDEKNLRTFGVPAVGDIYNTQVRDDDEEYAWPATPPPGVGLPVGQAR